MTGTADSRLAESLQGAFQSHYAKVNGFQIHYVTGGSGEPLVLLPGWPQTWWQARKILPLLAVHYRVIAVDLRGMGTSEAPDHGYDKKTMADDIYRLVQHLGLSTVNVAGHDIGSMVAFSLAANHSETVRKLAMLEEPHPNQALYDLRLLPDRGQHALHRWWFAFNQASDLPEQLLAGRARHLIDYMCRRNLRNPAAIDEQARDVYARAYSRPSAIRAASAWYRALPQDIDDDATYSPLQMPVAALYFSGHTDLLDSLRDRATSVVSTEIHDSGHYLAEEQPEAVAEALIQFFG
jgi:pimeloyl-ACP methyl ester carboxylesterase